MNWGPIARHIVTAIGIAFVAAASNALVTNAWAEVDAAIPDSFYKMLLRAFGWYVLERHY